jgi:hypothetical protein
MQQNLEKLDTLLFTIYNTLTMPVFLSILNILLLAPGSYNFEVTNFSTAKTTPSFPLRPITVLQNMCILTTAQINRHRYRND